MSSLLTHCECAAQVHHPVGARRAQITSAFYREIWRSIDMILWCLGSLRLQN